MLIFTHIARVAAVLGLFSGAIFLVGGWQMHQVEPKWGNMQFNIGLLSVVVSLGLGTLAEISLTLHRKQ